MHVLHEKLASNCQLALDTHPRGLLASGSRLHHVAAACELPLRAPLAMCQLQRSVHHGTGTVPLLGQRLLRLVRQ